MTAYKLEDMEVCDPLDFIRRHASMYGGDPPWGPQLAMSLMRDLGLLDALPARIERLGNRGKVDADKGWLKIDGAVSLEPFNRIITLPPPRNLAVRTQVLIAVLADAAVTSGADGLKWIAGAQNQWPPPEASKLTARVESG